MYELQPWPKLKGGCGQSIGPALLLLFLWGLVSRMPNQTASQQQNADALTVVEASIAPADTSIPTTTITSTPVSPANMSIPPTDIPMPTSTLSPEEALKAALTSALSPGNRGVERIAKVAINSEFINVQWSINDNLTQNLLKAGARRDVVGLLSVIRQSGLPYTYINLSGTFASTDKSGKTSEFNFVFLTYSHDAVEQINWQDKFFVDYVLQKTIYNIADTRAVSIGFDGTD